MMTELWIFGGLLVLFVGLLLWTRLRDSRRLTRTVREALSRRMREEIEGERAENFEKKRRFDEAMRQAGPPAEAAAKAGKPVEKG